MQTLVMLSIGTLVLGYALVRSYISANRLAQCTWDELLAKVHHIESDGVMIVAMDHLAPSKHQLDLQPEIMWKLV